MQSEIYAQMAYLEKKHWWFTARRKIIDAQIKQLNLPAQADILEAGCGTGGNLAMLSRYGKLWAIEPNQEAKSIATASIQNQQIVLDTGSLPDKIPFENQQFDLIVLLDVLEHLEADVDSLLALKQRLKPNGVLLITVPALPFLWSKHDEIHHHFRRYTHKTIRQCLGKAKLRIGKLSYYNFWLFPVVLSVRLLSRAFKERQEKKQNSTDLTLSPPWLNNTLHTLFASERYLLKYITLPIGVSLIVTAYNDADS
jgi:SAM-dependent methyltransferase